MTTLMPSENTTPGAVTLEYSSFTDFDVFLFKEGSHFRMQEKLGAHLIRLSNGQTATHFAVWAPNADWVSVIGDFNGWNVESHKLALRQDGTGVWEGSIPGLGKGTLYKFHVQTKFGYGMQKIDPFASHFETPPKTACVVWDHDYNWNDHEWMAQRRSIQRLDAPISIYEVHLGSWRRDPANPFQSFSFRDIAPMLADHVKRLGFTHVELMPVMEHPFYGSWGYQITGYFAPSGRFGTPQDFMYFVDHLHQNGIGVILDWVPSHFASDGHGLANFDGTQLFEHADPRKGYHPDWGSYIFNYGRNETREFLISNALHWLRTYHIDGLRVDAVASMLYLDYSRKEGEWVPNQYGGKENLEAISFIKRCNEEIYKEFPDAQVIAEESTAWPMVSKPTYDGGLGFGFKWNMGWMNDSLKYISKDPVYRKYHHHHLTFSMWYAFTEHFILSISHDEVVHGKGSMIGKMPGNDWEKFANLRLMFGYQFLHPGKKLVFMGSEFGQWREWNHDVSLDWHLLDQEPHWKMQQWVSDLNHTYVNERALHEGESNSENFSWVDFKDWENSIISFLRRSNDGREVVLAVFNFTPVHRDFYHVGVPADGWWQEILNSDSGQYGGGNRGNFGGQHASNHSVHDRPHSLCLTLPPLSVIAFKRTF